MHVRHKTEDTLSGHNISRRILIIDDDPDGVEILKILLSLEGHKVELAFDGESGLRAAADFKPEAVLLCTGLADLEESEIVKNLRWAFPRMLLVAMIGWRDEKENPLYWKEAGFDHHLLKPVGVDELLQIFKFTFNP